MFSNVFFRKSFTMIFLVLIMSFSWFLKSLLLIKELELEPHILFLSISSFSLALAIIGIYSGSKRSSLFTISIAFGITFLQYADLLYLRYYYSILRIELFAFSNQLMSIHDSVLSLMQFKDIIYFIDLPLIILIMWFYNRKKLHWEISKYSRLGISLIGITILFLLTLTSFKPTFSDQLKISITGIVPAHLNDISTSIHKKMNDNVAGIETSKLEELRKTFELNQANQKSSPYFGKYKGKNVIIVQAESLNTFPIGLSIEGQSVTPNFDSLIKESNYYPNTFLQIGRGNTSDAEFVANNSIYPMGHLGVYKGYPENTYLSLANVLNKKGYSTSATHGNTPEFWNRNLAYPKQGYSEFYHINHPMIKSSEKIGLGISDESLFKQMVEIYQKEQKPFYNFFISLTNHRPFVMPKEYQALKLPKEFQNTSTGHYLQSVNYFDKALGTFINELKESNLWDDSIFIVYGDHYGPLPIDEAEIKELLNVTFNKKESFRIPLIIHHPEQTEAVLNEGVGSQMDIYPTISALLGIEQPLVQIGTSLDSNIDQTVGFAYEINRNSFFSDDYDYIASFENEFQKGSCIDNSTKKNVKVEFCSLGYEKVKRDIEFSEILLNENIVDKVFKD